MIKKLYKLPVFWIILISGLIMFGYSMYLKFNYKTSDLTKKYANTQEKHYYLKKFITYVGDKSGRMEDYNWDDIHKTLLKKNQLEYKKFYNKHKIV